MRVNSKKLTFSPLSMPTKLADGLGLRDVLLYIWVKISPQFGSPVLLVSMVETAEIRLTDCNYSI
jgi:hypothetical protein